MKVVVIGGTGLIGSRLVEVLRAHRHEVVAASPSSGVDTLTGEGLDEVLNGADVVVDLSNSPSYDEATVLRFFATSGRNLLAAEARAGVLHHVALSIVGADALPDSGYLRAKTAQENLIRQSGIPYTILRSTQFFEFLESIADSFSADGVVRVPEALMQPIHSCDVVAALVDIVTAPPAKQTFEVAGPEPMRIGSVARLVLDSNGDERSVVTDTHARYFGTELTERSLLPTSRRPRLGTTRLSDWLRREIVSPSRLTPAARASSGTESRHG